MARLVGIRYRSAIFAACLFAAAGLIIPSHSEAEGKSSFSIEKNIKQTSTSGNDCVVKSGAQSDDCKSDSKIDLDRKGHKVKKSKSRGR